MFKNDDFYNMDSMEESINDKKLMLDLAIRIDILFELLMQHKIINDLEIDVCVQYVSSKPEFKAAIDYLQNSKNKTEFYKDNPQQHLKDLFNAKLNGTIK